MLSRRVRAPKQLDLTLIQTLSLETGGGVFLSVLRVTDAIPAEVCALDLTPWPPPRWLAGTPSCEERGNPSHPGWRLAQVHVLRANPSPFAMTLSPLSHRERGRG